MFLKCNNFFDYFMPTIRDFKNEDGKWSSGYSKDGKTYHTKASAVWHAMRQRCGVGGSKKANAAYADCVMSENFLKFQFFAEWCQTQIGYGLPNYQIDKDILLEGNRVYSEVNCVFVPQELNSFFCSRSGPVSDLPKGVTRCKNSYSARFAPASVSGYLGMFKTVEEASQSYQDARNKGLARWLRHFQNDEFVIDQRVTNALAERISQC